MKREMICISCPIGCHLTAEWENEETITISGNKCNRGEIYGREEILAPKRVVTATVGGFDAYGAGSGKNRYGALEGAYRSAPAEALPPKTQGPG